MGQDTEPIKFEIPVDLKDEMEECAEARGFNGRNHFIRKAIRDAVNAEDPFTEEAREEIRKARQESENNESIPLSDIKEEIQQSSE